MNNLVLFSLIMVITVHLFAQPNPPTNFKTTGMEGKVRLTWTNPSGGYDGIYIYKEGVKIMEVNNGNTFYEDTETPHSPKSYYLRTWVDNWEEVPQKNSPVKQNEGEIIVPNGRIITLSSPTTTLIDYAIDCWYFGTTDNGDGSTYATRDLYTNFNTDNWVSINNVKGGDTIYFDGGSSGLTYTTTIEPKNTPGINGNETSITRQAVIMSAHISGWCTGRAKIDPTTGNAFNILGKSWWAVKGFEITGLPNDADGIEINNGANNCLITENLFTYNSGDKCIKLQNSNNNTISRNNVNGSTDGGSSFGNGDFIQIGRSANNTVLYTCTGNIVEYNIVTLQNAELGTGSLHHTDFVQMYFMRIGDITTISNNYFKLQGSRKDGYVNGIYASNTAIHVNGYPDAGGLVKIYNNIIYFVTTGKGLIHIDNTPAASSTANMVVKIWNNTFHIARSWVISDAEVGQEPPNPIPPNYQYPGNEPLIQLTIPGVYASYGLNEIKNNIISDEADHYHYLASNGTTYTNYLQTLVLHGDEWSAANIEIDDNLYYAPYKTENNITDPWLYWTKTVNGTTTTIACTTLAQFKQASGQESNGDYGDPDFYNKTNGDFSINSQCTYIVIDAGTNLNTTNPQIVNWTVDFDNHERGTTWDRGAYDGHYWTQCKKNDNEFNDFSLEQNFPNPFNPVTKIKYSIPNDGYVSLVIYDALGREVVKLFECEKTRGEYSLDFNASNLASGVYYYRLTANDFVQIKKMVLLK